MKEVATWLPMMISMVVFLGAATVFLRGSRDKGTIETLERSNSALSQRVDILERNEKTMTAQIEKLTLENLALQRVANSSEAIAALTASLSAHHEQAMASWGLIHADIQELKKCNDE